MVFSSRRSFALGIVIISLAPGYSGSVQDFLFGSIVGVSNEDITQAAIMGAVILLVLWLFHRQIVTSAWTVRVPARWACRCLPWTLCCTFW